MYLWWYSQVFDCLLVENIHIVEWELRVGNGTGIRTIMWGEREREVEEIREWKGKERGTGRIKRVS